MSQLLALTSAAFYGFADFVGGLTTRRLALWRVTAWSMFIGVAVLAVGLLVVPANEVTAPDILWGSAAGVAGLLGLAILYSTLAAGTMMTNYGPKISSRNLMILITSYKHGLMKPI